MGGADTIRNWLFGVAADAEPEPRRCQVRPETPAPVWALSTCGATASRVFFVDGRSILACDKCAEGRQSYALDDERYFPALARS